MLMVRFLTEVLVCFCDATKASSKRSRDDDDDDDEEEESRPESSHTPPTTKKLRLKATAAMQVNTKTQKLEIEVLSFLNC